MTQTQPLTDDQKYSIAKEGKDLAIAKFSTHSYKVEKVPAFIAGYIAAGEKYALACIQKDEEIARLRKELEKIKQEAEAAIAGKLINTEQKSNMALYNIKWSATEALKQ